MTFSFNDFMNGISDARQATTGILSIPLSGVSQITTSTSQDVGVVSKNVIGGTLGGIGQALGSNPILLIAGAVVLLIILK